MHSGNTYYSAQNADDAGNLAVNSCWVSILVGGGCSMAIIAIMSLHQHAPGIWYAAVLVPTNLFFLLGCSLLIGLGMTFWFNILQLSASLLLLTLVTTGGRLHLSAPGFLSLTALAWSISALSVLSLLLPRVRSWRFNYSTFLSSVHYSTKAYFTCLFGLLVLRANVFLLRYWQGSESVGYFSVAAQMADALGTLPVVVGMLLFPKLVKDQKNCWTLMIQTLLQLTVVMAALCTLAGILAMPFIRIMYGTAFLKAVPVFLWILPGVFFLALAGILSQYLSARGFPIAQVAIWGLGLALILIFSNVLTSRFGLTGAALALSADYALIFLTLLLLAVRMQKKESKEADVSSSCPVSLGLDEL
jgi:O-antigen/teichoic acid export membrane protein